MSVLSVEHISQASVKQRAGRAGRLRAGFCFHLFTLERYNKVSHLMCEVLMTASR